ncbi:MAG: alpha/beta hydrolase [Pseudomonadota bacterium]
MFKRFTEHLNTRDGVEIYGKVMGEGPPLLCLHGYPQTHHMWHLVAPELSKHYTLVMPDLRGYGASGKPTTTEDHAPYSKREMAADMVAYMASLGFDEYSAVAHDRGARVAHRMGMDHPNAVQKLMLLDIAPTREMYRDTSDAFARAYWHWFFLILPAPGPERMIGVDPRSFWLEKWGGSAADNSMFAPEALEAYLTAFKNPEVIHASCEDYRAAASIDIAHDDADDGAKLTQPLRVLWGDKGVVNTCFDCLALWRERAEFVTGRGLPSGHFIAEEVPEILIEEAKDFFQDYVT